MSGKKITTLLFDLDGTLIDTNELIIQSYLHTLEQYFPGKYTREDVLPFMGPPLHEVFYELNPEKAEEMVSVYRAFNKAKHDELVTEFPGVHETVQILHDHNFKLGIVSTKKRDMVLKGLKFMNLDPYFPTVVTVDDVTNPKPHPEPIQKAMAELQSEPEETIMIGDNYHDIVGGKNAGTITCGVSWSLKGSEFLQKYEPDYMLEEMTDLLAIVGVDKR